MEYNSRMRTPLVEYIGWHQSALELVGERLLRMAAEAPDAFRRAEVVVPTAESGRRLKEWMAEQAKRPLLMPRMVLAGQLIRTHSELQASDLEMLAAWVEVLLEAPPHEAWPELFPHPVPERHLQTWALGTAERLMRLQQLLEQYEVTPQMLRNHLSGRAQAPEMPEPRRGVVESDEACRWLRLQQLFDAAEARVESWGREPGRKARRRVMETPAPAQGAPVIIACLPELSPQVQRYLCLLEEACPGRVRVWVNAPESCRAGFNSLGCVLPGYWAERRLPERLSDAAISVTPSARGLARAAVAAAAETAQEEVVLAACDASFTPALVSEFAKHGWQVHVPEGRSHLTTDLAALPGALAAACGAERLTCTAFEPLLRNVAAQRLAGGAAFDSYKFGLLLDKVMQRYLPDSAAELLRLLSPDSYLPGLEVDFEVGRIRAGRSAEAYAAAAWLHGLVKECRADMCRGLGVLEARLLHLYSGEALEAVARQMAARVRQLAAFLRRRPLPASQAWALLRHMLQEYKEPLQESPREATQLDALGWRELAYARGSRLVITGLHEGCVPELPAVDPFLPDSLRQALGMPCAQSRETRDAFLFEALLQREQTEVRVVVARSAADGSGSPVAPSSLLYRCDDERLVARVQHLYQELPVEAREDRYEDWSLAPAEAEPSPGGMESVLQIAPHWRNPFSAADHCFSPSEINAFLACPLRFWMKHALGISPGEVYKPDKVELEAAEYGTLLHGVLEQVGLQFREKHDLLPLEDMLGFAQDKLAELCTRLYGQRSLPAMIRRQLLRLRQCLRPFLLWHEAQLRAGWRCEACEHKVTGWELPLPDGSSARLSMRADRIDYHPESKTWRIIDYKTHARAPKEDHLERLPAKKLALFEELMGPAGFTPLMLESGRKGAGPQPYRWRDVQLPVYAYWLMREKGCALPQVAYYNLPRAGKEEPVFQEMPQLDAAALELALDWAKHAILLMRAGCCLYSAETFDCHAFGSFSDDEELADPRSLFHTLPPL